MDSRSPDPNEREDDVLHRPVSRRRAAFWGIGFGSTSVSLIVVRNLVLVPFFVTRIGHEEYGAWLATGAVLVQLTTLDFGLLGVVGQRVARAYGARERAELEQLVGSGLLVTAAIALGVGVLAALCAPLVAQTMRLDGDTTARLTQCILLACAANVLHVAAFGLAEVLKNLQRPAMPGAHSSLGEAASLVLTFWLLQTGYGLYSISIGLMLRGAWLLVGNGLAFASIGLGELRIRPRWSAPLVRSLFRDSVYLFGTQVAFRLRSYIDPFLVGLVMGPTAAGVFALTLRSHETIKLFSTQLSLAVLPGMAHLFGEQSGERFRDVVATRFKMQAVLGAVGLGGCIAFNQAFVQLWVGDAFYAGNLANFLFALGGLVLMLGGMSYEAMYSQGEFRAIVRVVWLDSVGRLPFVLGALAIAGFVGAGAATLLTTVAFFAIPMTRALIRRLDVARPERVRLGLDVGAVCTGVTGLAVAVMLWAPAPATWLAFAGHGALYLLAAVALAAALDPAFVRFLLRRGQGSPLAVSGRD